MLRILRTCSMVACCAIILSLFSGPGASALYAAPNLPPGFVLETYIGGLLSPRAFVFAPDGRVFIAERGSGLSNDLNIASVRVFKDGALLPKSTTHAFEVCGDGERGFLGLALDPNFSDNNYLYVYYTRTGDVYRCGYNRGSEGPRNRVSRVTMGETGVVPDSEVVLLDHITADGGIHNAGDLHFDAQGNLLISTGNGNLNDNPSQDVADLGGKILRIRPDDQVARGYTIPADNPYASASGARFCGTTPPQSGSGPCREVYASGFRNPFRFTIDARDDAIYAFDVGGGAWEEINKVVAGGDYGHPQREGLCDGAAYCLPGEEYFGTGLSPQGYHEPLYSYKHTEYHNDSDAAVIGGAFYTGNAYPSEYHGNLFFADYARGWIKRLVYDANADSWSRADFATGLDTLRGSDNSIIGVKDGPDGNLYILHLSNDEADGRIYRLRYTLANRPPTAQISADPIDGALDTVFTFSAAGSSDPDDDTLTYLWDFGDGETQTTSSPSASHEYDTPGAKTITLTVRDDGDPPLDSEPVSVQVFPGNAPPTAAIALENVTTPGRDLYHAGDEWRFTASDVADDQTDPADMEYEWEVVFHHREHTHPFLLPQDTLGTSGVFTIPTNVEVDHIVWYRVYLRVTDSFNQTTEIFRDVFPVTTQIAISSDPPGMGLSIDAQTLTAPITLTRVVGLETLLEAPQQQTINGDVYTFVGWSNGADRQFTLTVPAGGGSYTATYERLIVPSATSTATPTATATPTVTATPTGTASATATSTALATATQSPTATITVTVGSPTVTPTPSPTSRHRLKIPLSICRL
jgi:glucose/arabinose dehydrogenase